MNILSWIFFVNSFSPSFLSNGYTAPDSSKNARLTFVSVSNTFVSVSNIRSSDTRLCYRLIIHSCHNHRTPNLAYRSLYFCIFPDQNYSIVCPQCRRLGSNSLDFARPTVVCGCTHSSFLASSSEVQAVTILLLILYFIQQSKSILRRCPRRS